MRLRWMAIVVMALALAFVMSGCASEPPSVVTTPDEPVGTEPVETPAAGAAAVPMGTAATSGDWTLTVRRVQRLETAGGIDAQAGNEMLVVTMDLANGSTVDQGTGPNYFVLSDADEGVYAAAQTSDPAFIFNTPQPIKAGETRNLSIAYEIPVGTGPFTLTFTPFVEGGGNAPAVFEIK